MAKKILCIYCSFVFFCISCSKKLTPSEVDTPQMRLTHHRSKYKTHFINDQRSPLKTVAETDLLDFYEYNGQLDLHCKFDKNEDAEIFEMPTYSGTSRPYVKYGTALCQMNGRSTEVSLYRSSKAFQNPIYQNLLFLPFKDLTNDEATYGGGRYIDLDIHDIVNDSIDIDFNKCYNPWCAFSDGYNCPIPPKENHFNFAIEAGEKKYKGKIKKN